MLEQYTINVIRIDILQIDHSERIPLLHKEKTPLPRSFFFYKMFCFCSQTKKPVPNIKLALVFLFLYNLKYLFFILFHFFFDSHMSFFFFLVHGIICYFNVIFQSALILWKNLCNTYTYG